MTYNTGKETTEGNLWFKIALVSLAVVIGRSLEEYLKSLDTNFYVMLAITVSTSTSSYLLLFKTVNWLDKKILWRFFSDIPDLNGRWTAEVIDVSQQARKISDIRIEQTRDCISANGSTRLDSANTHHSIWNTIFCAIVNGNLIYVYEVNSVNDETKRGLSILRIEGKPVHMMKGKFNDLAPNSSRGTIVFRRTGGKSLSQSFEVGCNPGSVQPE
ncbi:MAG: hypothetical protein AAGG51_01185 [Cyanobacteria bacterium P01_G01_bin.54]